MVAMALGFCALSAAGTAGSGGSLDEAVAAAEKCAGGMSAYFYVDTLDYLRRGGRIGAAQALLGSALAVKPLLQLDGGRIEMLEKVRTASKAIARLEEIAADRAGTARWTSRCTIWRHPRGRPHSRSDCGNGCRGLWTCTSARSARSSARIRALGCSGLWSRPAEWISRPDPLS